jgi:damage-control phosphatase, subfamily III
MSRHTFRHSPKLIPWFVSDVTPADFKETIAFLQDSTIFHTYHPSPSEEAHLSALASRLQGHLESGAFSLSVDPKTPLGHFDERANFWTEPWPGWDMKTRASTLWETLSKSQLVIFKVCRKAGCLGCN